MSRAGTQAARQLRIGGRRLTYVVRFANTKRLSITVHPDLTVTVRAPHGAGADEIERRVRARTPWLHRQLRDFERYHPLPVPRRYVSGETHLYLGRQYRLRVRRGVIDEVRRSGGFLWVTVGHRAASRDVVEKWYAVRAREVFARRLQNLLKVAPWLNGPRPAVRVCAMTRRWGSCGRAGVITLNRELVKAPPSCIDYILAHELLHRVEMSHSRRFYALLERVMPGWERARERLNRVVR